MQPEPTTTRAAIYARVSTLDQHAEMQVTELAAYAGRMGWPAVSYIETASGKSGSRRPVLAQLLRDAAQHKIDTVLVWKIDRFGRSLSDLISNLRLLDQGHVRFIAPNQGIDTDIRNPFSKMLMHILGVFAEFERDLIQERVDAGIKEYRRAFEQGKVGKDEEQRQSKSKKNLAHGRPKTIFRRDVAAEMHDAGLTYRAIGLHFGVHCTTVQKILKATKKEKV